MTQEVVEWRIAGVIFRSGRGLDGILGLRNTVNSSTSTGEKAEHMGTEAGVLE